jgi:hypothetical protein
MAIGIGIDIGIGIGIDIGITIDVRLTERAGVPAATVTGEGIDFVNALKRAGR